MMPHITEIKMAMRMPMPPADIGESVTTGNGSSDLSRIFSMSYWKDTNSSIMFFTPGRKKAKLFGDSDDGMVTSFSNIDSQERTSINKRVRRLQDLMTNMDKVIVRYRNFTLNLSLQVACNFILLVSDFPIFSMHIVDASMNLYPSLVHLI